MKPKEFIDQVFLGECSKISSTYHYISFAVVGLGIEFLGACLDSKPFGQRDLSTRRFTTAVKKLFPQPYRAHAQTLCSDLRNGFAHQFRPGMKLELTKREEAPTRGWKHLQKTKDNKLCLVAEDFYEDFAVACRKVISAIEDGSLNHPKLHNDFLST